MTGVFCRQSPTGRAFRGSVDSGNRAARLPCCSSSKTRYAAIVRAAISRRRTHLAAFTTSGAGRDFALQIWHAVVEAERAIPPRTRFISARNSPGANSPGIFFSLSRSGNKEFNSRFTYRFRLGLRRTRLPRLDARITGYPIVDAGMRELWQTGWMHNRVRMIAASFLIKDLMIDWRHGEQWFRETLVDADPHPMPPAGNGSQAPEPMPPLTSASSIPCYRREIRPAGRLYPALRAGDR